MNRCEGKNKNGSGCKLKALGGTEYCMRHNRECTDKIIRTKLPEQLDKDLLEEIKAFENSVLKEHYLEIFELIQVKELTAVFFGRLSYTGEDVVIKIAPKFWIKDKSGLLPQNVLQNEIHNLRQCMKTKSKITADFIDTFDTERFIFLVSEKLPGENLYSYFKNFKGDKKEETSSLLDQMLDILHVLHTQVGGCGSVHRDISAGNFITTPESDLYLIDFELARQLIFAEFLGNKFAGTVRYMSVPAMREETYTPSQDLEGVVYVLSEFYEGTLPWQGLDGLKDREEIIRLKEDFVPKHPELRDLLEGLREK